jgi:hypothetical protein
LLCTVIILPYSVHLHQIPPPSSSRTSHPPPKAETAAVVVQSIQSKSNPITHEPWNPINKRCTHWFSLLQDPSHFFASIRPPVPSHSWNPQFNQRNVNKKHITHDALLQPPHHSGVVACVLCGRSERARNHQSDWRIARGRFLCHHHLDDHFGIECHDDAALWRF